MAEIEVLPTVRIGSVQIDRLVTGLDKAYEASLDLGSRAPHIQATGESLRQLAARLKEKIGLLSCTLAVGP